MKQNSNFFQTAFRLLKMIRSLDYGIIPLYMLTSLVQSVYPFVTIVFSGKIIDALIDTEFEKAILFAGIMILINAVMGVLLHYLLYKREVASMVINRRCNSFVALKAVSLDYATFENKETLDEFEFADGNISSNGGFGSYILHFSQLLNGIFSLVISFILLMKIIVMPIAVEEVSFWLTPVGSLLVIIVILMILGILYVKIFGYVGKESLGCYYKNIEAERYLNYFNYYLFTNEHYAKEIRMYHMQPLLHQEWKKNLFLMDKRLGHQENLELFSLETSGILNDIFLLLAYLFVAVKTYFQAASIGLFAQTVAAMAQLNKALKQSIDAVVQLRIQQSYLNFYVDFIEKKGQMETGTLPVEKRNDNEFEIEFHDVSFRYPNSEEDVLKHISIKLDLKKHFAVVGRNGAGKTTFIKLLCRLYDVSDGYITLNGIDIRKYDYQEYINLFATVFQDFKLFSIPVGENVACSGNADENKVWQVLESVGVKDKVEKMPDQLNTRLYHEFGEGESISGGEAQKIAIARALYKDAPFVILDEPTAALDPISEHDIYQHFDEMVKDKTSIYISHRMSSCRFCDDILVFDKGELVQRGNHDFLMDMEDSVYRNLWEAQAKYYEKKLTE